MTVYSYNVPLKDKEIELTKLKVALARGRIKGYGTTECKDHMEIRVAF